ncbi:MAG: endonuclease III, partial [Povalibacter sp.]
PDEFKKDAHHWLILHGRYICLARKPGCPECPILDLCEFKEKTKPEALRQAAKGKSSIAQRIRGLKKRTRRPQKSA